MNIKNHKKHGDYLGVSFVFSVFELIQFIHKITIMKQINANNFILLQQKIYNDLLYNSYCKKIIIIYFLLIENTNI